VFDTVHLEIPKGSPYRRSFTKALDGLPPETARRVINRGREYSKTINLECLEIPALLHVTNLRNKEGGDKFEFFGAGTLGVGQMANFIHEVYRTDVDECDIMRLDATADIDGAWVPWFRDHVRVMGKQCYQEETPGSDSQRKFSKHLAETIYWGRGTRETIVYDKTGERLAQLKTLRRRMFRAQKNSLPQWGGPTQLDMSLDVHFEQHYGYRIFEPKTRVERRMGGREIAKAFHIPKFGDIQKAAFINPYNRMQFPEIIQEKWTECNLDGKNYFMVQFLREYKERHGWQFARNEIFRRLGRQRAYRWLRNFEPYLLPTGKGPTQEDVRKAYLSSTLQQLAA
jgi:hypothetical protein